MNFKREKQDFEDINEAYSVGGGVALGEESRLSEVAEIEGILVPENVEVVVVIEFEN